MSITKLSARYPLIAAGTIPASNDRPCGKRPRSDDGFATTTESFCAFFIIEAGDLKHAIEIASMHPGAHVGHYFGGGIEEVRSCDIFERP